MKIKATTSFKHGKMLFEEGKLYEVADGPGYYFCASGWAQDQAGVAPTGDQASGETALKVDDVMMGLAAPNVG